LFVASYKLLDYEDDQNIDAVRSTLNNEDNMEAVMGFHDTHYTHDTSVNEQSFSRMKTLTRKETVAMMHKSVPRERDPNAKYMYCTDQPQGLAIDEIFKRSKTKN